MTKTNLFNWKLAAIIYILSVLAFSINAKANQLTWIPSDIPTVKPKNLRVASGEIAFDLEGKAYLVTNANEVFELVSENVDLSVLDGAYVRVEAIEARHNVGPVLRTQSLLPLVNESNPQSWRAPLLIVLSVKLLE